MIRSLATAILLGAVSAALCGAAQPPTPHPAVVRVIAPERGGTSFGSGTLVAVSESHGLVVTNWHVVRDATGPISVVFPDGFRSKATVMKTNRDWDLAALAISKPRASPVRLASRAPRRGERLTIAGYGSGWYRTSAGRCTQYVSPGGRQPFEMVELSTAARNGDSGGPIFNDHGELAGVLFGSGFGRTTGSYCGRVQWFLTSLDDQFRTLPSTPTMIAQRPARPPQDRSANPVRPASSPTPWSTTGEDGPSTRPELAAVPAPGPGHAPVAEVAGPSGEPPIALAAGPSRAEQIKTILAAIGVLAILFHAMRLVGALQGS